MPHVGKLSRIFIEMISPVETFACVLVQFAQKIQAFEFCLQVFRLEAVLHYVIFIQLFFEGFIQAFLELVVQSSHSPTEPLL